MRGSRDEDGKPDGLAVRKMSGEDLRDFCRERRDVSFFQSELAFSIYSKAVGCSPMGFGIRDGGGALIGSVLGIQFRESKVIPGFLSSHVTVRGGPVMASAEGGAETARALLAAVVRECRDALYVRCYPAPPQVFPIEAATALGFRREKWLNATLDIAGKGMEALDKVLHSDKRRGIKRAQKSGVVAESGETAEEMETFYHLLEDASARGGFRLQDKSLFQAVATELIPRGVARLFLAKAHGDTVAGRLVLAFNGVFTDWYAASNEDGNKLHANDLLVWKALEWSIENGGRCFDLGGAGRSEDEYGVGRFKERFGSTMVDTGRYTWTRSATLHGFVNGAESLRSKVRRRSK